MWLLNGSNDLSDTRRVKLGAVKISHWKSLLLASFAAAAMALPVAGCTSDGQSAAHQSGSQTSSSRQDGCRFATAAEIAEASGIAVDESTDNSVVGMEHPGCFYTDAPVNTDYHLAVGVDLYGSDIDAQISRVRADPQGVGQDVPGLGQRAIYGTVPGQSGGWLYVKADSAHGFSVALARDNDQRERSVAVAKVILPRIQSS